MFHKASQPNPFDLLGGMFIIEGLGNRIAGNWGRAIQYQLQLRDDQVSFFTYHETSDSNDNHFERFEKALQAEWLDMKMASRVPMNPLKPLRLEAVTTCSWSTILIFTISLLI